MNMTMTYAIHPDLEKRGGASDAARKCIPNPTILIYWLRDGEESL